MEISSDPFLPNKSFSFLPAGQAIPKTVEIVEEFKYLGIPIHLTLTTHQLKKHAIRQIWRAQHAAENAGMRPQAIPMASRATAWKAFILPHILFYIPFLTGADAVEIQTQANLTLKATTYQNVSTEAVMAEFGILPVKHLWASSLCTLASRLQTNVTPLRTADIFNCILHSNLPLTGSFLHLEYKKALFHLHLQSH